MRFSGGVFFDETGMLELFHRSRKSRTSRGPPLYVTLPQKFQIQTNLFLFNQKVHELLHLMASSLTLQRSGFQPGCRLPFF